MLTVKWSVTVSQGETEQPMVITTKAPTLTETRNKMYDFIKIYLEDGWKISLVAVQEIIIE